MGKKVLWLDNDSAHVLEYQELLEEEGYEVTSATSVSQAEALLETKRYDLVILDVMIPTKSAAEEKLYSPDGTDKGFKTGLVFYRRMKEKLEGRGSEVLVLTVRLDQQILSEFIEAGLPRECFATKFSLRESEVFRLKVRTMLGESD